jgi:Phage gp6-like head-tail connector protein
MLPILTVVEPATTHDLTTLATVKDELGIRNSKSDARLRRYIREASAQIEQYCNRVFAAETVQEVWEGGVHRSWWFGYTRFANISLQNPEVRPLRVRRYPIISVTSIVVDGTALTPSTDFEIDADNGLIFRLYEGDGFRSLWFGERITIVYVGGYALLGSLPYPIEQACLTLIKHRWAARDRDPMLRSLVIPNVQEETYWVGATGDDGAIPPEVAGLLAPYREVLT